MTVRASSTPDERGKMRSQDGEAGERGRETAPPFDTSELERIPTARADDPPYLNWWVVDSET